MPEMHNEHDHFRDDIAAYALGSLDAASARQLEMHLQECAECRELLREYQEVIQLLPLGLEPVSPPDGADERLLERARDSARVPTRRVERPFQLPQRWVLPAAAVLLLMLLGGVAALVAIFGGDDEMPDAQTIIRLSGSENAPNAVGQLIVREDGTVELVVSDLPRLPAGEAYQFWFVQPDDQRMSGGLFTVDPDGESVVLIDMPYDSIYQFDRVGVTVEPEGGSPGPTGINVLAGRVQNR